MVAVRTVVWQLVQPASKTTPPAAASADAMAVKMAAANEPAGFIHTKRRRPRKYGPGLGSGGRGSACSGLPSLTRPKDAGEITRQDRRTQRIPDHDTGHLEQRRRV